MTKITTLRKNFEMRGDKKGPHKQSMHAETETIDSITFGYALS